MKSNRISRALFYSFAIALLVTISACNAANKKEEAPATPAATGGIKTIHVVTDPGLESIVKQQQFIYEAQTDSVKIALDYKGDADMLAAFREGSADLLIMSRTLTQAEKESLINKDTIYTRETKVAYDAVALIGSKEFNNPNLDTAQLRKYFNPANSGTSPKMVFDKRNSSVVSFMLSYFGYTNNVSPNLYAVQSPEEVVNYVAENKDAIGFIPYSMVADADDDGAARQVLEKIKVLSLRAQNAKGEVRMVSANQSDIADGGYPLIRTVNTVMRYTYDGTAWPFVSFLTKEKAARIFLKAGLVPLQIPFREIDVNTEGYKGIN